MWRKWQRAHSKAIPEVDEENRQRMEKSKQSKSARKKFQSISGDLPLLLMLKLGDNQVLQFHLPKDTTSRLQNNKPFFFYHTTHRDALIHQVWARSLVYFHPFIRTKPLGEFWEEGQTISVCVYCVYTCKTHTR